MVSFAHGPFASHIANGPRTDRTARTRAGKPSVASRGAMHSPVQLPLAISLRPGRTFANFEVAENGLAVQAVREVLRAEKFGATLLTGAAGSGKTHLLEACCAAATQASQRAAYVPLGAHQELRPEVLEGLAVCDVVCLDDVEAVAGDAQWEIALFNLYNQIDANAGQLVATSRGVALGAPLQQGSAEPSKLRRAEHNDERGYGVSGAHAGDAKSSEFQMPDLASRLRAALIVHLRPLADAQCRRALAAHAKARGLNLSEEVAAYILARFPRDMHALISLLEHLDHRALSAGRRLSIPFVREEMQVQLLASTKPTTD